ncbi:MAG: prenyltransferase/squalene oxidase repeat-containing protein [Planctomycetota bacterium]
MTSGMMRWAAVMLCAAFATVCNAQRMSDDVRAQAEAMRDRAIEFLRQAQDDETGAWSLAGGGPEFPAITALALNGMLLDPEIGADDDTVRAAVRYLLSNQQPDGGIHAGILPSYNTACSVSALSRVDTAEAREAVEKALPFLLKLQWGVEGGPTLEGETIDEDHPFFGGVGYGNSGRPDMSNLTLFLQALEDAGYESDGEAVQRALVFLQRTQMLDSVNDMPYAEGSRQGGFVYSTSPNGEQIGVGESKAGEMIETLSDGTRASRLRSYGSMTYAGFKSLVYADLDAEDERVAAAFDWLRAHYTLSENPELGDDGYYYYILVFGRALDAWDDDTLQVASDGGAAVERRWAEDLVQQLATLQQDDGSFRPVARRWLEYDPVLITAYTLISLGHALEE